MTDEEKALTIAPTPALTPVQFGKTYDTVIKFVKSKLVEKKDFDVIPGTQKKSLLKPGAEKLAFLFNLKPELKCLEEVRDVERGYYYFKYECRLIHFGTNNFAGSAIRSCNSWEKKYLYTTVKERFATEEQKKAAVEKITKQDGNYTNVYLKIKKSPEELANDVNTIEAMAQKRATVAAVVLATMASEIFDANVEEEDERNDVAPNEKTTKEDDPYRCRVISSYFVACEQRGITQDQAKKIAYDKLNVTSISNISTNDIARLTEGVIKAFRVVGEGNKPERINNAVETTTEPPKEEKKEEKKPGVDIEKMDKMFNSKEEVKENPESLPWEEKKEEAVEEGEVVEAPVKKKECATCGNELSADNKDPYYCDPKPGQSENETCRGKYYDPTKKKKLEGFIRDRVK